MSEQNEKQRYETLIKEITPTHSLGTQILHAFTVGGIICTIGQVILNTATDVFSLPDTLAASWCSILLIFLSAVLTGFGIYPKLVKWGGAGALVPITGFANSIAASAIEYKKEGQVFGLGSKIFVIAGPVILFGVFTSWILGILYWISGLF